MEPALHQDIVLTEIFNAKSLYPALFGEALLALAICTLSAAPIYFRVITRQNNLALWRILGIVATISLIVGTFSTINTLHSYISLYKLLNSNSSLVAEGNIRNYRRESIKGRYQDAFDINGVDFHYGQYSPSDGFHISAAGGDLINDGRYVRIMYSPDRILKIEMKRCGKEISFSDSGKMDCLPSQRPPALPQLGN